MITVTGPCANKSVRDVADFALNDPVAVGSQQVQTLKSEEVFAKVPEVSVDYVCTRIENIVNWGDGTCTCLVTSVDEAEIAVDSKYTVA